MRRTIKLLKQNMSFVLLILLVVSPGIYAGEPDEEPYDDYEFVPSYYIRTEYGRFEKIEELPRDTIIRRDTIYISELDDFLQQYDCDLKQLVEKHGVMKSLIDSINQQSSQELFYNFFLPKDSQNIISNRFIAKEFRVTEDMGSYKIKEFDCNKVDSLQSIQREILFTCNGGKKTDIFLNSSKAITKHISEMFTNMQEDREGIDGINLFFPDFTFREKRALVQFVKSVRITMDASEKFKFRDMKLTVIFRGDNSIPDPDKSFQYSLLQEATEVVILNSTDSIECCAVIGTRITKDSIRKISLWAQLKAHFFIARFNLDNLDITKQELTEFKGELFEQTLHSDYLENSWEIYLFILIGILLAIAVLFILYYTCLPFSSFLNDKVESVLFIGIIVILEITALILFMFRSMCYDDSFSLFYKNPSLIFIFPLVLILIIPLLYQFKNRRKLP